MSVSIQYCQLAEPDQSGNSMDELLADAGCIIDVEFDKHETMINGRSVCLSEVHEPEEHLWRLNWIGTDKDFRHQGIGGKHLQKLLEWIKEVDPQARALFFEIESRRAPGLSQEQAAERESRGRFYEGLGASCWPGTLLVPATSTGNAEPQPGATLIQMELMWFPLANLPVSEEEISKSIVCLLRDVVGLGPEHALFAQVLAQDFSNGIPVKLAA